ncbi:unnamed protein product [Brassica rapa subsp. trilocularis]
MILSVVREEKLSLLYWSLRVSYMEVWMTNEIDGTQAALWSKSFTVKNPNNLIPCFMSFLVDEEKKLVLGCNSAFGGDHIKKLYTTGEDSGYSTEIPSVGSKHKTLSPFIFSYVPSLQPTEPTMAMFQHGSLVHFQGPSHSARGQSVIECPEVLDSCKWLPHKSLV